MKKSKIKTDLKYQDWIELRNNHPNDMYKNDYSP